MNTYFNALDLIGLGILLILGGIVGLVLLYIKIKEKYFTQSKGGKK